MKINRIIPTGLSAILVLLFAFGMSPAAAAPCSDYEAKTASVALGGYSPVSYQQKNKAEKGSPRYSVHVHGKTYYFTGLDQERLFLNNPEKYLPAFDGYCAYGLAKDAKFESNPETFKLVGGRTFLFLNDGETNTHELWEAENERDLARAANFNWERMTGEGPLAHYNLPPGSRLGLQGYCPVAYFAVGKAVKGSPEYTEEYRGVTYQFVNADAAKEFRRNPAKYEPAFGGWCATGMMVEQKFPIDPDSFKIVDGRLFLFKKDDTVDALKIWNETDEAEAVGKATAYWNSLLGE